MPFTGFGPATLSFLSDLAQNNDKSWFNDNRERYLADLVAPAVAFVEAIGPRLLRLDPSLTVEARVGGSIFRIHRDTRFSRDKRPYKEELAFRFRGGDEGGSALLMRIRPDLVGVAAGVWEFSPAQLAAFRAAVAGPSGAELATVLEGLGAAGCGYTAAALKRVPAPFPADHPRAELLKQKGLTVGRDLPLPAALGGPEFVDWAEAAFVSVEPVHRWLQSALGRLA